MTMYTAGWIPVAFERVRIKTIWMESKPGERIRHETRPKRLGRKSSLEATRDMQAVLRVLPNDLGVKEGALLRDGTWESIIFLKADDGWKEIVAEFQKKAEMTDAELNRAMTAPSIDEHVGTGAHVIVWGSGPYKGKPLTADPDFKDYLHRRFA